MALVQISGLRASYQRALEYRPFLRRVMTTSNTGLGAWLPMNQSGQNRHLLDRHVNRSNGHSRQRP
jgi:hypothetical protein